MKNKPNIIIALIFALTISGGLYVHTYATASKTIGITEPTANITTSSASTTQPDWDDVLIPVNDSIILRPDSAGDETDVDVQYPGTGEHWDKVDEEEADETCSKCQHWFVKA